MLHSLVDSAHKIENHRLKKNSFKNLPNSKKSHTFAAGKEKERFSI